MEETMDEMIAKHAPTLPLELVAAELAKVLSSAPMSEVMFGYHDSARGYIVEVKVIRPIK